MRLLMGVLLAMLLAGCDNLVGQDRVELPATMSVHPSFGGKFEVVFSAADDWRRATGGAADLRPEVGDDGGVRIRPSFNNEYDAVGITHFGAWTADLNIDLTVVASEAVRVKVSVDDELKDTVMHELGHAFGIDHQATGLMVPAGYGGGCVDALTLSLFCENYWCPDSAAPTCD